MIRLFWRRGAYSAKALKGTDGCDQVWENDVIPFLERAQEAGAVKLVYDIDAKIRELNSEVINAAALIKYECLRRGIDPIQGEAGMHYRKENWVPERIEKRFKEIVYEKGDPKLQPVRS
jgi:hypothetical protein